MSDDRVAEIASAVRLAIIGVFSAVTGLAVPSIFGPRAVAFGSLLVVVGFLLGAVAYLELPGESSEQ